MITVFYDGACGLCSKEIRHYKKIAQEDTFVWCDVMQQPEALDGLDISLAQALKVLHAQDSVGRLYKGVDAFILMWQHLPRWWVLAKIVRLPLINSLARRVYTKFSAWRFQRLSHCQFTEK